MAAFIASTAEDQGRSQRLLCRGRLDVLATPWLRRELVVILEAAPQEVVMDLTQAEQVDAAAVATLAGGVRALRRRGAQVAVLAPYDAEAGRILDYCGISSLVRS